MLICKDGETRVNILTCFEKTFCVVVVGEDKPNCSANFEDKIGKMVADSRQKTR